MKDVDQLFRDKLNQHERPYHGQGWERIEKSLQSEKKPFAFWKVAAAIALTLGFAYGLFHLVDDKPMQLVEIPSHQQDKAPIKKEPSKNETSVATKKDSTTVAPKKDQQTKELKENKIDKTPSTKRNSQLPMNDLFNAPSTALVTEKPILIEEHNTTETAIAQLDIEKQTTKSSTKIVLTLDDTNKFLSQPASRNATSENVSSSTLEMAVAKAKDLKNNHDPLAELRQIKNDILALNFKNKNVEQY
jgi:hypothetical protein